MRGTPEEATTNLKATFAERTPRFWSCDTKLFIRMGTSGMSAPVRMIFYTLISLVLSLIPVDSQSVCTPISCVTSVVLNSTTTRARNPPYACRGEQLVFNCEVMNAVSLQWASEPDILCDNAISYTAGDDEGETRPSGLFQSYLISVVRNPPNSNFSSNLTFTPSESVTNVTVVCGNQLSLCSSTEAERTVRITDVPIVPQESLQHFISSQERCPNISVLIQIAEIQDIATLTYKLTVSSSAGCALPECPMLLNPGERILTITLLNGVNYNATLEVSNDCGPNSTTVTIQPECEVGATSSPETPGTRRVEVLNVGVTASTGAVAAVAVVATLAAITTAICTSLACYMNKVKMENHKRELQIIEVVRLGSVQLVKDVAAKGGKESKEEINKKNDSGRTVLHIAARGNVEMIEVLIALGVNKRLSEDAWRKLLEHAAGVEIVKHLISEGADVNIQDGKGRTPLHLAAKEGHKETVVLLIQEGAKISIQDNDGMTPIHLAAEGGHVETVKSLVKKGDKGRTLTRVVADEDEENAIVNSKDIKGETPLHIAARKGHVETVEFLIKEGAEINIKDIEGQTPLHIAAREGNTPMVELMSEKKAEFNIQDINGNTPLHIAAGEGHEFTVKFLFEKGANIENNAKMTPLEVARKGGHMEIVRYLQSPEKYLSNGSKSVAIFNRLPWLCAHLTEVGGWAIGKKPTTPANYRQTPLNYTEVAVNTSGQVPETVPWVVYSEIDKRN